MISDEVKNEIIKEHIENRISQRELAEKYGIHKTTVNLIIRLSGQKSRYWKKELLDEKEILRMYVEDKISGVEIAKKIAICSLHPIYRILRKYKVVRSLSDCHKGQPAWNKGKQTSQKVCDKLSNFRKGKFKGKENPNWRGGKIRTQDDPKRLTREYKHWRIAVKKRDGKCLECGSTKKLHSHHIVSVRNIKDLYLLIDINNGITLCKKCHKKTYMREKEFEKFYKGLLEKGINSGEIQKDNPEPADEITKGSLGVCDGQE